METYKYLPSEALQLVREFVYGGEVKFRKDKVVTEIRRKKVVYQLKEYLACAVLRHLIGCYDDSVVLSPSEVKQYPDFRHDDTLHRWYFYEVRARRSQEFLP